MSGRSIGVLGKDPGVQAWPIRVRVFSKPGKLSLVPTGLFPYSLAAGCQKALAVRADTDLISPDPGGLQYHSRSRRNWPGFLPSEEAAVQPGHPPFVCLGRGNC